MNHTTACLFVILLTLSACQNLVDNNGNGRRILHEESTTCQISAEQILTCLASSKQLSQKDTRTELNALFKSLETQTTQINTNKLLCLSLHRHSSLKQLQQGAEVLKKHIETEQCQQQELKGLLRLFQGKTSLHKQYLDKNWKQHLEMKKLTEEYENKLGTCQRRIQDLEKQVQKLIEVESMLDQKIKP